MDRIRAVFIFVALASAAVDHARAEIPIGLSTALTGPQAWVGEPHLAGIELAVGDLNAKGGILGDRWSSFSSMTAAMRSWRHWPRRSSSVKQSPSPSAPPARALRSPPPEYTVAPAS